MKEQNPLRDTIIKVDLNALKSNVKLIHEMCGCNIGIMAVVKANGYGHGACGIADALIDSGVDYLAVATLSEALELKKHDPSYPVFILGHTPDRLLGLTVAYNITQTVFSINQAYIINKIASESNITAKIHIKVDTGFHRLGKEPSAEYANEILQICKFDNIDVEGIFSHLALVNDYENDKQFHRFCEFIKQLEYLGCSFKYKHIADSIACVDYPEYRMNMIRPGALIYGMRGFHKGFLPVKQILTFETRISQLHTIKAGEGVGYDHLWRAKRDSLIATLPFGYADGYPRNLKGKGYVMINGGKAPLIGVLCMDQCMADVTEISNVKCGSTAVIYGDGSDGSLTVDEASKLADTNKNEILSRLSLRSPRIYK